ncbi:MAG: hypothetical protein WCL02_08080 [bacterium]
MKTSFTFKILFILVCFIGISYYFDNRIHENNQNVDFVMQFKKLECNTLFTVSELTHPAVIEEIERQLKRNTTTIDLVVVQYKSLGISYLDNRIFCSLDAGNANRLDICIFDSMLFSKPVRFMKIASICK